LENEFTLVSGKSFVKLVKEENKLDGGYQIGFTNETKGGMSGGPVLTQNGLVVGINGRGKQQGIGFGSADPSVKDNNPYNYQNGQSPSSEDLQRFKNLSWAIPIETYSKFVNTSNTPPPKIPPSPPNNSQTNFERIKESLQPLLLICQILNPILILGTIFVARKSILDRLENLENTISVRSDNVRPPELPYSTDTRLEEAPSNQILNCKIIIEYKQHQVRFEILIDDVILTFDKQISQEAGEAYYSDELSNLKYSSCDYILHMKKNLIKLIYQNQDTTNSVIEKYSEISISTALDSKAIYFIPTSTSNQYKFEFERNITHSNSTQECWILSVASHFQNMDHHPLIINFQNKTKTILDLT
jgi:hypothetical protein